jgi:hypothetical protein
MIRRPSPYEPRGLQRRQLAGSRTLHFAQLQKLQASANFTCDFVWRAFRPFVIALMIYDSPLDSPSIQKLPWVQDFSTGLATLVFHFRLPV